MTEVLQSHVSDEQFAEFTEAIESLRPYSETLAGGAVLYECEQGNRKVNISIEPQGGSGDMQDLDAYVVSTVEEIPDEENSEESEGAYIKKDYRVTTYKEDDILKYEHFFNTNFYQITPKKRRERLMIPYQELSRSFHILRKQGKLKFLKSFTDQMRELEVQDAVDRVIANDTELTRHLGFLSIVHTAQASLGIEPGSMDS